MANPHPIAKLYPEEPYHAKNAITSGVNGAAIGGAAGLIAAAVQNSLAKSSVGAGGIFSRSGATIATMTAVPTVYCFVKDASANLREKDDTLNTTIGAFFGGAMLGLRSLRMPQILGQGALISVVLTAFDYTGGRLSGSKTDSQFVDEYERKEYLRNNRRRPLTETVADLGEGRGIEPPGYEERRRERLREKYGVEINPVSATVE
ncbi:NADH-ubiquinone oxidoreductase subunit A [Pestalotiopsis fici W106-1]|uniref:NADH-ubiquinone oxidoreductase subunit A n=1 Tax=Pestalotiopsis fici (strain W106-1 / CGMCC3.15140) TaxID=1229662 RepID=W3WN16_PESFW|nr:NADH-ubiquinone oxidoreductase subunit A [Pestalotiopsis fici W106-1]ETS75300.1 NADH-ubiquinone oxidoreductase subunit A [Pestalotiopsis fici W106-1]